ncbi:MAG: hypothetical protein GWM98_04570 [Nitrospinaceae bacterium]|nr:hypothetical protein [Deltaproteobacteria bacterium]NIY14193.1 hypothetical protein [Nitrospinaceae bacterium]
MTVAAIDPGSSSGVALFDQEGLWDVFLLKGDAPEQSQELHRYLREELAAGGWFSCAVVEIPQIYDRRKWKGDPNDLIKVAVTAGALAGTFFRRTGSIEFVKPATWKGSRPKEIDNEFTLSLLTPDELLRFERAKAPKSKRHNLIDAIGIGLWKLKRR